MPARLREHRRRRRVHDLRRSARSMRARPVQRPVGLVLMAKILFRSADRDEAHQHQAKVIASKKAPKATCTQDAYEVIVWDKQPMPDEVESARADRGAK